MSLSIPSLEEDTLFLACTRPAMIAGVTMEAMGINVMLTNILFIMAGSLKYVAVGIVIHFVFRSIIKYDHNMFRILMAYLNTKGRCLNASFWGGSSLSPLRLVRYYDERDLGLV